MKSKKLQLLEGLLRWLAVRIIRRHQPKIVAITGSVGKTTTKEAVGFLLGKYFSVRQSAKNYNNEIGVPLTIIGADSGKKSWLAWLGVFFKGVATFLLPVKYPEVLVLEMGADRPGDIKYLAGFVPIDVGVITSIGISHLEYFKNVETVAREKGTLLKKVKSDGLAIFNGDNEHCRKLRDQLGVKTLSYGIEQEADVKASDVAFGYQKWETKEGNRQLVDGILFKLNHEGKIVPIKLSHGMSFSQIYAVLAAFSVASYFQINLVEASQALDKFQPPLGRMILLKGIKNSRLIDDSYNSAPDSVRMALRSLSKIEAGRKLAVLGDMLELGSQEEFAHRQVGKWLTESGVDFLLTVGNRMKWAREEFEKEKKGSSAHFDDPMQAGMFLQQKLKEGDVVLIKGSQGMRMEKVVVEVMAEPNRKEELTVRQDETWQATPFKKP